MKMSRIGLACLTGLTAVSILAIGAPASAATPSPTVSSGGSNAIQPLYDPGTVALCNEGFGDVSLNHWKTSKFGKIDLFCGDDKSGYVHIRSRHQKDWQKLIDKYKVSANWDDLMDYAVQGNLLRPTLGYPQDVGNGKWCYSSDLAVQDSKGNIVATYYPVTIVSASNKRVITAYPSSTGDCGGS